MCIRTLGKQVANPKIDKVLRHRDELWAGRRWYSPKYGGSPLIELTNMRTKVADTLVFTISRALIPLATSHVPSD